MWRAGVFVVVSVISAATANQPVTVITEQLELGRTYDFNVNNTVEYILEFTPSAAAAHRVRVRSEGGDVARPLLIVVRHPTGARTLQLPYSAGELLQHELERTLCTSDDTVANATSSDCGPANGVTLSLHVWTWCARSIRASLSVTPADLLLPPDVTTDVTASIEAAAVRAYRWDSQEESGRGRGVLVRVDSDDDVCATIAILHYHACPIEETLSTLSAASMRFTMLQNGGVHIPRSRFPKGFLLVAIVHPTDDACADDTGGLGQAGSDEGADDLWQDAVLGAARDDPAPEHARVKSLRYTIMPAISPAQYATAAASTLALLALFYLAFFGLVAAQRLPAFYKYVAPKKLLVATPETDSAMPTQVDGGATGARSRNRRLSTATFDSSDNSDTDEEEEVTSPNVTSDTQASPIKDLLMETRSSNNETESRRDPAQPTTDVQAKSTADRADVVDAGTEGEAQRNGGQVQRAAGTVVDGEPPESTANVITNADQARSTASDVGAYGLPAQLRLAALARRRERTLSVRSRRYLHALLTVAVFYALPVLQLVAAFQLILNASGSLDLCYYNFLCALPAGALSDFNHVLSNAAYLLLGALLLLAVRRRRRRRRLHPPLPNYGIPEHFGLMEALGAGMMAVALLSSAYHVCPNRLNFQFDTAFMYVLAVVSNIKMYQSRHPDVNARAHATFGVLAVIIAFGVWGVLGGRSLFWGVWTVIHVFSVLLLSLRVYYVGQWRLGASSLGQAAAAAASLRVERPLYATRLAALAVANFVNWGFAIYGLVIQPLDFAGHLLSLLLCNALLHMCYYLGMKLASGERLRWYSVALTAGAAAAWAPALYLFVSGSSDWSTSPARSRLRNHTCLVLQFYDAHDLWHLLSAAALFLSFCAMLTWDDGLAAVPRDQIHVF